MSGRIAVNDANILIDFFELNLLEKLMILNLEMYTTDLVLNEITNQSQRDKVEALISNKSLVLHSPEAAELSDILKKFTQTGSLSLADCSVWHLAEQKQAILLSGDRKLRKVASQAGVEVHGALWLLDKMVEEDVLELVEACAGIRELIRINPRLPIEACEKRVKLWCGGMVWGEREI